MALWQALLKVISCCSPTEQRQLGAVMVAAELHDLTKLLEEDAGAVHVPRTTRVYPALPPPLTGERRASVTEL